MLTIDRLRHERCVAICRAGSTEHFVEIGATLAGAGLGLLEFPLTTPGVLDVLPAVRQRWPRDAVLGVGSVTCLEQAQAAVAAGAEFLVTPTVDLPTLRWAADVRHPVLVGAATPTEIRTAHRAGALAVKVFPAARLGGTGYLRDLLGGPFPDIPLVPTGGVHLDDAADYLRAGAQAVGMAGALLGDAASGGCLDALARRALDLAAALR